MIKSAHHYFISNLFEKSNQIKYLIPPYQREYSWKKTECEILFNDIQENKPGYFLGTILCVNQTNDTIGAQVLEVIDGQQRLITLTLLFAALYHVLCKYKEKIGEDEQAEIINLKKELTLKGKEGIELRLMPQSHNKDDYWFIFCDIGLVTLGSKKQPPHVKKRKLFKAFDYFKQEIEKIYEQKGSGCVIEFLDKLRNIILVKIEVENYTSAYILFESLNNRGMPLTVVDLIKNKFFTIMNSNKHNPDLIRKWENLIENLGDNYSVQERFLRHYYNAFRDDLNNLFRINEKNEKKYPLGTVATRTNLIAIYEKIIENKAFNLLDTLLAASESYALILSRNENYSDPLLSDLRKPLKDLEHIQGVPSYLLLFYLLEKKETLKLVPSHLVKIVNLLVAFFLRRNLTDTPPTRSLTDLFMSIIEKIIAQSIIGEDIVYIVKNELIQISANNDRYKEKLAGSLYTENDGVTRFILCSLAEQGMTKENWVDLWERKTQYIWSIEHVFPQGENIPDEWVQMIANGDQEEAKKLQEHHVHRLGNLTLSGYNAKLSHSPFEYKKERVDKNGNPIGYKNGLKLNEDIANAEKWTIDKIEMRTQKLINQVLKLFPIE